MYSANWWWYHSVAWNYKQKPSKLQSEVSPMEWTHLLGPLPNWNSRLLLTWKFPALFKSRCRLLSQFGNVHTITSLYCFYFCLSLSVSPLSLLLYVSFSLNIYPSVYLTSPHTHLRTETYPPWWTDPQGDVKSGRPREEAHSTAALSWWTQRSEAPLEYFEPFESRCRHHAILSAHSVIWVS